MGNGVAVMLCSRLRRRWRGAAELSAVGALQLGCLILALAGSVRLLRTTACNGVVM